MPRLQATGNTLSEGVAPELSDWMLLSKRLIAAGQIGIRIEQDSGHRWIFEHTEADFCLDLFHGDREPVCSTACAVVKEYSSITAALDLVDAKLQERGHKSLISIFDGMNYFDDLGVVFGSGTQ